MRRFTRVAASVAATLAGCLAAGTMVAAHAQPAKSQSAPPAPAPAPPMFSAPEYVMGNPNAKVTVVEYASASCPHCARFDINQFPAFKTRYIDTGKVRYVFREFITEPAQVAVAGFMLARCAGEKNYWMVVEDVFRAQNEIYATNDLKAPLLRIAKSVGLSEAQVQACLTDKAALDALNARVDDAVNKQKVDSTPTFVINGKVFRGDEHKEVDVAELGVAIDPLLSTAPQRRGRRG